MNNQAIICIVGPSGCGKTTIVESLCEKYDLSSVQSYTTRPRRSPDETGHTFITEEEFFELKDVVASNKFAGNYYCATQEQIDNSDFYVVDLPGVQALKSFYRGHKKIFVIGLYVSSEELVARMKQRGDHIGDIVERRMHDQKAFEDMSDVCDIMIHNQDVSTTADLIHCLLNHLNPPQTLCKFCQQRIDNACACSDPFVIECTGFISHKS
jgi:guanylate kinase